MRVLRHTNDNYVTYLHRKHLRQPILYAFIGAAGHAAIGTQLHEYKPIISRRQKMPYSPQLKL